MDRERETQDAAQVRAAASGLAAFSSTALATGVSAITREVLQRGAVVITKHAAPVMVLMSVERYAQLERAGAPDLDALTREFDDLYGRMQSPGVATRTIDALDLRVRSPKAGEQAPRRRT